MGSLTSKMSDEEMEYHNHSKNVVAKPERNIQRAFKYSKPSAPLLNWTWDKEDTYIVDEKGQLINQLNDLGQNLTDELNEIVKECSFHASLNYHNDFTNKEKELERLIKCAVAESINLFKQCSDSSNSVETEAQKLQFVQEIGKRYSTKKVSMILRQYSQNPKLARQLYLED